MLATNLKTLKGMAIVKAHEHTRDAQQVFMDLIDHYTTSIAASTRAQILFQKITVTTMKSTSPRSMTGYVNTTSFLPTR